MKKQFFTQVMLITPCFLVILNDLRRIVYLYFFRKMPSREEVEPNAKIIAGDK
jgi:hypothetical protein